MRPTALGLAAVVVLAGFLSGCAEDAPPAERDPPGFDTIESGFDSNIEFTAEAGIPIFTQADWQRFWDEHTGQTPDDRTEAPPLVDFSKQFVAALFMGEFETGGYAIFVEEVAFQNGHYEVGFITWTPGPACFQPQIVTHPYDIVAIDLVDSRPLQPDNVDFYNTRSGSVPCGDGSGQG